MSTHTREKKTGRANPAGNGNATRHAPGCSRVSLETHLGGLFSCPWLHAVGLGLERAASLFLQQELARAKQDGLLPESYDSAPAAQAPQTLEERKNAVIEEVKGQLQATFGKGAKVGAEAAPEKPAANS